MQNMNASTLISQLAELLNDLSQVQDELLSMLAEKRDKIADNDLGAVAELQPRVEQLCDSLQACHERRAQLLALANEQGHSSNSLGELVNSLPPDNSGMLPKQVKDASEKVRLLQHHSLANWVLAQRSILHLSQLLEIIATGGQLKPTYGSVDQTMSSGALVDGEA